MSIPTLSPTAAADATIPSSHPFVNHLARVASLEAQRPHRAWAESDGPIPSLYVSHGAPPLLEDPAWMTALAEWARALPRPRGIVVVSAHWESAPAAISSSAPRTPLVYDFGGFDPIYYEMQYATPDASALAAQLRGVLSPLESLSEHRRGLDHGAWVPLKAMYPEADIPVLQLSLPTDRPDRLLALGERLAELRQLGVLVIGSGFMTHGLRFVDFRRPSHVPSWSADFDAWANGALSRGDLEELAHFRDRAPGISYAHPTVEHFTPLFVTLGAAGGAGAIVTTTIDGYMFGLSKRSFQAA